MEGRTDGKPKTMSLRFSSKKRGTIKPTIAAIRNSFSDVLHFATGVALQCGDLRAIYFRGSHR